MARALPMVVALLALMGADGCSLLVLDDMSANADKSKDAPTSDAAPPETPPSKDETLPTLPVNDAGGVDGASQAPTPAPTPAPTANCPVVSKTGSLADTIATGNGRPFWSNPLGARTADGQSATVSLSDKSERLNVRGFGFDIPANATIKGVLVDVTRSASAGVQDLNVNLEYGAELRTPVRTLLAWTATQSVARYGSADDLWNVVLTPAILNAPIFGFNITVESKGTSATARVEEVKITVRYCVD